MEDEKDYDELEHDSDLIKDFETPVNEADLYGDDVPDKDENGEEIEPKSADADESEQNQEKTDSEDAGKGGEEKPADQDTGQQRSQHIPRERFDEVYGKYKDADAERERLQARIAELEGKSGTTDPPPPAEESIDIKSLEREYIEAIEIGDSDAALDLRDKINAELRAQAKREAMEAYEADRQAREAQASQAKAQELLQVTVDKVLNEYPVLNENQELVEKVVKWRDFYATTEGLPLHKALEKATQEIMPLLGKEPAASRQPEQPKDKRKGEAVARGVKDASSQPPALESGLGNRVAGFTPPTTQEDWENLSPKERERELM